MKKYMIALIAFIGLAFTAYAAESVGTITGEATATEVELGYTPAYIKVVNETDNLTYEYFVGIDANKTVLTTGSTGVISYDTATLFVSVGSVTDDDGTMFYGFSVDSDASDVIYYEARQ